MAPCSHGCNALEGRAGDDVAEIRSSASLTATALTLNGIGRLEAATNAVLSLTLVDAGVRSALRLAINSRAQVQGALLQNSVC